MHRLRVKAIAAFLSAAGFAAARADEPVYRMVPWAEISGRDPSALATLVRNGDPANWYYAESAHLVGHARSIKDIDTAMTQAEFAWAEVGRLLQVAETGRKAHLILVGRDDLWEKLVNKAGVRPDGLAFQVGREIFVRAGQQVHVSRIPHEMVHFRLRDTYGKLPLWLEEGLALQYGWRVARLWADQHSLTITRSLPPIPAESRLTLDALTAVRQYPARALEAQAYYRQAEELTLAIVAKIGLSRAGDFLKATMEEKLPWRVALAEQFEFTNADFESLASTVDAKSGEVRDD